MTRNPSPMYSFANVANCLSAYYKHPPKLRWEASYLGQMELDRMPVVQHFQISIIFSFHIELHVSSRHDITYDEA